MILQSAVTRSRKIAISNVPDLEGGADETYCTLELKPHPILDLVKTHLHVCQSVSQTVRWICQSVALSVCVSQSVGQSVS